MRSEKMSKKIMLGAILLVVIAIASSVEAGECEYGKVEAWVRTLNENGEWGEWKNATVHETLKVHEPFQVKVKVTTKVECSVSLWLSRSGTISAYEVVEGSSSGIGMDHAIFEDGKVNWSNTYQWTIRPTGNWTNGVAALNIRTQFHVPYDNKFVDFTIIAAYIESEEWEGNINDGGENNGGSGGGGLPGFGGLLAITGILSAGMIVNIFRRNSDIKNG